MNALNHAQIMAHVVAMVNAFAMHLVEPHSMLHQCVPCVFATVSLIIDDDDALSIAFWSLSRYSGDECVDGLNMKPWYSAHTVPCTQQCVYLRSFLCTRIGCRSVYQ